MTALLAVRDLHVAYGKVEAVHGVSLDVDEGRIVTVIGPNGAGKTTLLARDHGLAAVARRRSRYDRRSDRDACRSSNAWPSGLCLVPETRELFAAMSVADNLELGAFPALAPRSHGRRHARRGLPALSAARGAPLAACGHAFGRRATDAGARTRADGQAEAADARRAEPRSRAADRARDLQHHRGAQGDAAYRSCWSSRTRARRCRLPITAMSWRPAKSSIEGTSCGACDRPARRGDVSRGEALHRTRRRP